MKLKELLKGLELEAEIPDIEVADVKYNSRLVEKGDAFVANRGAKTDGNIYIGDAVRAGASVIISETPWQGEAPCVVVPDSRAALSAMSANYFGRPSERAKVIGVTGTNGKTTTTYMLKAIIEAAGGKVGLIGTNQHMIGDKVLESHNTTPESYELHKMFAQMLEQGVDYIIMEVSSHSLALHRVDDVAFDVGVFTNLTQDHLDFHRTMDEYLKAKTRLFNLCTAGVINADDPASRYIMENSTSSNFTFSVERNDADVMAKNLRLRASGVDFELLTRDGIRRIETRIPGKFTVYNALGSITCAMTLGIPLDTIAEALSRCEGVKGRVEVVPLGTDYTVIIDYAHTPDGIVNVLSAARGFCRGRLIALFGCGGDRDRTKRPKMGRAACELADYCVITSDNPRTEDPDAIIADILEGIKDAKCGYKVITDRSDAIEYALSIARKDDVIVLCGKGHETYQILKDRTIHYDEREVLRERLEKIRNRTE